MSIQPHASEDLAYNIWEIDRTIGEINSDYMDFDSDLIRFSIDKARTKGGVALLDAGCGIGLGLISLKDQVSFRAPIDESHVEAWGVSLIDYRGSVDQTDVGWREKERLYGDYIKLILGNLATVSLPEEHFDAAYSAQVMLHNTKIEPIIKNVLPTLKRGGAYYFDTQVEQGQDVEAVIQDLPEDEWHIQTQKLTRSFLFGQEQSRLMHKIVRRD